LVFYRSQPWREKSRTPISAPFCAYATVINETPDLDNKHQGAYEKGPTETVFPKDPQEEQSSIYFFK
jgi:hypothetical protein